MLIEAISLRGYCRTFRPPSPARLGKRIGNTAFDPAMRITKLTTIASTGRLMKRSVNDFNAKIRNPNFEIRNKFEYGNSNSRSARLRYLLIATFSFEIA